MISTDRLAEEHVFELTREELDALPYGVITLDRFGTILRYNYTEAAFARRTTEATVGLGFFTDVAPCTNVQAFKGRFDAFAQNHDSGVERFDFTFAFRWGSQAVSITLLRMTDHEEINLIVRAQTQATLDIAPTSAQSKDAARAGASDIPAAASSTPPRGALTLDCAVTWELGSPEESLWRANVHPDDAALRGRIVEAALLSRQSYGVEYRLLGSKRKQRVVQEYGSFTPGTRSGGRATIVDVTERRRQESDLWRLARFDPLTGLPNRAVLLERIAAAASEARETGRIAAIFSLAVTRFESLSERFGHQTSDELLRLVGMRLGESIRGGDTVAHLTSEIFVVLLTDVEDVAGVTSSARRTLEAMSHPFAIDGRIHHLSASLGISVTPRNGSNAAALLQAAETAMFASRKQGRGGIAWFSTHMSADVDHHLRTEEELRAALEREEFVLHYQPIVDVAAGRIMALEALVRWNHPSRGLVMPGDFIAVAEHAGLIVELGEWVLRDACRQARRWHDLGLDLRVCVNVSSVQFRQPDFVDVVRGVIEETGIAPRTLELELTESVMIDGFSAVIETLTKLKLTGARLAIDDFGTGYSSLAYLKYFPVDTLKIDRAFVADIAKDTFDRAIAKAVLTLAADLHMECVAEGVENEEQLHLLRELGCRHVQGYYFSRPQPPADLYARLSSERATPAPLPAAS